MTTAILPSPSFNYQASSLNTIKSIFEKAASIAKAFHPTKKGRASVACVFNDSWAGRIRGDAINKIITRIRRLREQAYEALRMGKPRPH